MDRILIILKKENGPRDSSAPALGLNTIIFEYVYWYVKQISGERLQDHLSSGFILSKFLENHHCSHSSTNLRTIASYCVKNVHKVLIKVPILKPCG